MKSLLDTDPILVNKTVAIHNFVEPVEQKAAQKKEYVLYFGRYSVEKGIATLVQAAKELPDIQFIFAGSGPLEHLLADVPNIKNGGFQTGNALENLIREAKFTVYPSECYENCPFSVLESLSFGTPVLGANIGGIPELIRTEKTGELFESGNIEDLKGMIVHMYKDKERVDSAALMSFNTLFATVFEYIETLEEVYNASESKYGGTSL
jgi:glycosyltransferase involved in cell wall biosynthesis